jgi:hypothetical protein
VRYLGTLENIFTYNGYRPHHELVLLYRADSVGRPPRCTSATDLDVVEADGTRFDRPVGLAGRLCESGALRLVPEALLDFPAILQP